MAEFAKEVMNFTGLMIAGELNRIEDLNVTAPLYDDKENFVAALSLRDVLYKCIKLDGGDTLFASIHQHGGVMGRVEIVHPNTPEAEEFLEVIYKNITGFLWHYLPEHGDMPAL